MSILKAIQRAIRENDLIESDSSTLLVGVSGGVDSLVLLHALVQLRETMSLTLVVATLDHRLRGDAGAADAAFVEETARAWGIPCEFGAVDVAALAAEKGMSIEQAARHARHDFFADVAHRCGIQRVTVAHHADDQAETVLLHLVRGAGIGGLKGMTWSALLPGHPDLTLIRPMLGVRRREIEAYALEHGLTPRHDATNDQTTYTRNRVRLEVLPLLRQINPDVDSALIRLASNVTSDDRYLNKQLAEAIRDQVEIGTVRISLPRAAFRALPSALQRRFVLWGAHHLKASQDDLPVSHERVLACVAAALDGLVGTIIELGGGLSLRVDYEQIVMQTADSVSPLPLDTPLIEPDAVIAVTIPGETILDGWRLCFDQDVPSDAITNIRIREGADVSVRTRRTGDRFRVRLQDGLTGTRLISRWMIDARIPRSIRERIPLLVIDSRIAAILWKKVILSPYGDPVVDDDRESLYHISLVVG